MGGATIKCRGCAKDCWPYDVDKDNRCSKCAPEAQATLMAAAPALADGLLDALDIIKQADEFYAGFCYVHGHEFPAEKSQENAAKIAKARAALKKAGLR